MPVVICWPGFGLKPLAWPGFLKVWLFHFLSQARAVIHGQLWPGSGVGRDLERNAVNSKCIAKFCSSDGYITKVGSTSLTTVRIPLSRDTTVKNLW